MKPEKSPAEPLLDKRHAVFIRGGVSINVASRDAQNLPCLVRALGCRVSADRRRVTLFVPQSRAGPLLQNLRENGAIAVVFSLPSTHQTIQLKGRDARVGPLRKGDAELILAYRRAFAQDLMGLGYNESFAMGVLAGSAGDSFAVSFTPNAAFEQTPGPGAGRALGV